MTRSPAALAIFESTNSKDAWTRADSASSAACWSSRLSAWAVGTADRRLTARPRASTPPRILAWPDARRRRREFWSNVVIMSPFRLSQQLFEAAGPSSLNLQVTPEGQQGGYPGQATAERNQHRRDHQDLRR